MLDSQTVRDAAWRELRTTLDTLNRIPEQLRRGDLPAADMLIDDVRRGLGSIALLMADGPDAIGYAKLLRAATELPQSAADAEYIERLGGDVPPDPRIWQQLSDAIDGVLDARS